ncbi:glutamate receptor 2.8-like isoform X1 [Chenopodium quinoa]|uniref:glutamate receptor 2.8-like isoform X1 n=1 Tax=Chenopodium quinoa TaxID=63459 RepID=UPI000B79378C|nr:glutamate receptor 2.8-like isoform X1 [Chenopodium quinoa]
MDSKIFAFMKPKLHPLVLLFSLYLCIIFLVEEQTSVVGDDGVTTKIGAILDLDSRMGKEQRIAIEIAVENAKISVHFIDHNQRPLQTAFEAEALIKEKKVEVIIVGIEDWQTTTLVAKIGSLAQVPVLSLAASPPITSPFASRQWPFLVQMSHNAIQQVQTIASIIQSYLWRRVIVVYEDDVSTSCGNCGKISLLTTSLQNIGSQIEHHLVLPPLGSTTNPRGTISEELLKFANGRYYSRVFIVLRVSLPYVSLLFEEAKGNGLMRDDSAWILSEDITNFLPSLDYPTMLNMEGAIGIMAKFDNSTKGFEVFDAKFGFKFLQAYEKERYYEPSFQALIAYDAITTIIKAKQSLSNNIGDHIVTSKSFLQEILQSNFTGLSGKVIFDQKHHDLGVSTSTRLVNIASSNYREVLDFSSDDIEDEDTAKTLANVIKWPGNLTGAIPKGWAMPTNAKPIRIGVPISHNYNNYINYTGSRALDGDFCLTRHVPNSVHNKDFKGYSVHLFKEVLQHLDYRLPYVFIPYNGSFDNLIGLVHNKCFDAAIGDITILGRRMELVDFTLPYKESGLSIIRPASKSYNSHGPWIFLKPFTTKMWIVTFFIFVYNMIIIWALEHGSNSEFRGTWRNQLGATAWFTINSLYFALTETISSKLARVVVIMWFFMIMILTSSYIANLTSMITNDRLNRTSIDVEMLQRTNAKVGYDKSSFVNTFLEDLLKFNSTNIIPMEPKFEDSHMELKARNISAACLEYPYAQLFVTKYCNKYIMTNPIHRFGGFGFVFPKGSPITDDVSKAILKLTELDRLKHLEKRYLNINRDCTSNAEDSNNSNNGQQSSLSLESFQVLFYVSGAATSICLLASFIPLSRKFCKKLATRVIGPSNN